MPRKPTGDPVLEERIEHAMRPCRSLLPEDMQEVFEDILVMAYTEHPMGQAILRRLRPQATVSRSGPRPIVEDGPSDEERVPHGHASGDAAGMQSSQRRPRGGDR